MSKQTGAAVEVHCRRTGRKHVERWGGHAATGYKVLATRRWVPLGSTAEWVAGFAVQSEHGQGWYVVDVDTGDTIFGLGASTEIGPQLENCLFLFGKHLSGEESSQSGRQ